MVRWMSYSLLVGALLLGSAPNAGAAKAKKVRVNSDRVLLADLLSGVSSDAGSLDMGRAPSPGQSRIFTRKQIKDRMRKAMVSSSGLRVPSRVRVVRPAQRVNEMKLTRLVQGAFQLQLPAEASLERIELKGGIVMPRGQLRAEVQMPKRVRTGSQSYRVKVFAGESVKELNVRAVINRAPAGAHEMVERGAALRVRVRSGGVVISTRGIAQQAGRVGQRIAVLPSEGRKMLYGVVVDAGTVEVQL